MHVSPRTDISWPVGELERIDFRIFCGTRVLFRADQRNSTRFGIILCRGFFVFERAKSLKYSGLGSCGRGAVK